MGVQIPEHGITCFHCGEVFETYGAAADHFGADPSAEPGCLIEQVAVEEGGKPERGRGLLMALRKAEAERDEWMARALKLEELEDMHAGHMADMQRTFGTTSVFAIADRLDNERFRADHAMRLLDAAGIAFDQPTQVGAARPTASQEGNDE